MSTTTNYGAQRFVAGAMLLLAALGSETTNAGVAEAAGRPRAVSRRFNWAAPPLIPVHVEPSPRRVILKAGGEQIALDGDLFKLDAAAEVSAQWSKAIRDELTVFSLQLRAAQPVLVQAVHWFAGRWSGVEGTVVQSTGLQDNVLFLRKGKVSFFLSLDFSYSKITPASISYPAHETLAPGVPYACHTLSVGACELSGIRVGKFDRAEIEAVSAYVERRFPMRFERPMFVSCCITNRMTYARNGLIFYSMYDNPTLALSPKLLEEDIRLCGEVGIEYFQVFEGVFDWPDEAKTGQSLRRLKEVAGPLGVRLGDYVVPEGPYCAHYNYENRVLERPEWRKRAASGDRGAFCLGCPEYARFLTDKLVAHNRKYGGEIICLDGLGIAPCYDANHRHPPGDVYQQVRGLVSLCEALGRLSPAFLVWSNSGNFIEVMPKLVWCNPNVYLTDPVILSYAPSLNALRALGDSRREQMVKTHDGHFVPLRSFCNCEYYLSPRSRIDDTQVFEYSFLQGLAVTPNVCPVELRTFLNRIPSAKRQECVAFMRRWMSFVRDHYDLWKHTAIVGDGPGVGAAEIYAHVRADRGFVCLVNQNPFPRTARFGLDGSIGLSTGKEFLLREIYPRQCPLVEQPLPHAALGDEIACVVPPASVRFIQIEPATAAPSDMARIFGLPARVERTATGYTAVLSAPQGETAEVGIVLPAGQAVDSIEARQAPTVKIYTFPASARVVERSGNVARAQIQFPRERAPREILTWKVSPGDATVRLPRLGQCSFLGGLVHGAFSEDYEVRLDIRTKPGPAAGTLPALVAAPEPAAAPLPKAPQQTFTARFDLPFIEPAGFGCMPGYSGDTVLELAFDRPDAVKSIAARINGRPVEVRKYSNPRRGDYHAYYIELTGNAEPGPVELAVDIVWP